jgi:hypothetical protein
VEGEVSALDDVVQPIVDVLTEHFLRPYLLEVYGEDEPAVYFELKNKIPIGGEADDSRA